MIAGSRRGLAEGAQPGCRGGVGIKVMTHRARLLAGLWSTLVLSVGAQAAVADASRNPYQGIAESNVFRLRPPAPPVPEQPPPPLPRITLMGITTFADGKRALLKVHLPARPGERPEERSYILTEGQRAGEIELLRIDEVTGRVEVNNSGTLMALTFATDGPTLRNVPPPPLPMQTASRLP